MDVAVVGAGSWGTALARVLCAGAEHVRLWARDAQTAVRLQQMRENPKYLPGYKFPVNLTATGDLAEAVRDAGMLVIAVPSAGVEETCMRLAPLIGSPVPILSAPKGLECGTGRRMREVIASCLPNCAGHIAAISGPNLAVELAAEVPTAGVVASADRDLALLCRSVLATPSFRLYTNADITGVELGGALKNVLAIAAGICEGMGFGDNTKAVLLTRGLAEMTRLGEAMGARAETFAGLSGVGDLIATSASRLSRNLRVGIALGQGKTLEDALRDVKQVAEGVPTTRAAVGLAELTGTDMPIARETYAVLFEGRPAREGLTALMSRRWRDEPD